MNSASVSYWERVKLRQGYDFVIIGGGIVGVNAAITIATHAPKASVLILERGVLPHGASTKNAGFACFGSVTELLDDLDAMSETEVVDLVHERWQGLSLLRQRLRPEEMAFDACAGYEVFLSSEERERAIAGMPRVNELISSVFDDNETFELDQSSTEAFGLASDPLSIRNRREGSLDPMKMMDALAHQARLLGVQQMTGADVQAVEGGKVVLSCGLEITAGRTLVATNGFARRLVGEVDMAPARAQVLITRPIAGLKLRGVFHLDRGYYYFRNVGDRILFGGGRHLDYAGETTTEIDCSDLIMSELERVVREVIAPNHTIEIDHRWAGIMGVGPQRVPLIREIDSTVFCAVRLGGMGVALGSRVGDRVARMALES